MLYTGFKVYFDLRDKMNEAKSIEDFRKIALDMKDRRVAWKKEDKIGWYSRYQKQGENKQEEILKAKEEEITVNNPLDFPEELQVNEKNKQILNF